jgi:predicted nucleic acid-binding protein
LIVVDASLLTAFLLGMPAARDALAEELTGREHELLRAPELVELETLSALRRLARSGRVPERRASQAVLDLGNSRLIRYPHEPLRERVWELRDDLSAYDASYLALAEGLGGATLMTLDRGLAARSRASLGASRVRHVT